MLSANEKPLVDEVTEAGSPPIDGKAEEQNSVFRKFVVTIHTCFRYVFSGKLVTKTSVIGTTAVSIVVLFVLLLHATVNISPLIFISLAENQAGDFDMSLTGERLPVYNFSIAEKSMTSIGDVKGISPRWTLLGTLSNPISSSSDTSSTFVIVIDSEREKKALIGRSWKLDAPKPEHVHVTKSTLRRLQISKGQNVTLNIDFSAILKDVGFDESTIVSMIHDYLQSSLPVFIPESIITQFVQIIQGYSQFKQEFIVEDSIDSSAGKFPSLYGSVTVLDSQFVNDQIVSFLENFVDSVANPLFLTPIPIDQTQTIADVYPSLGSSSSVFSWISSWPFFSTLGSYPSVLPLPISLFPGFQGSFDELIAYYFPYFDLDPSQNLETISFRICELFPFLLKDDLTVYELQLELQTILSNSINTPLEGTFVTKTLHIIVTNISSNPDIFDAHWTNLPLSVFFENDLVALEDILQFFGMSDVKQLFYDRFQSYISSFSLNSFAMEILLTHRQHIDVYFDGIDEAKEILYDLADTIVDSVDGVSPVSLTTNLLSVLSVFDFIKLFLDQLLLIVLLLFIFLGCMLIYSLLISDVEMKTHEFGLLRALGLPKRALVSILGVQSFSFSIPGILVGFFLGYVFYVVIALVFAHLTNTELRTALRAQTIILTLSIGLVLPIIANIFPIKRALARTIRYSLDFFHQTQQNVIFNIRKLKSSGISPFSVVLSSLLVFFGILAYYFIPSAFFFGNLSLFFTTMVVILLCLLIGLSFLSFSIQPFFIRFLVELFVHGKYRKVMKKLVLRNISSHSKRNFKTSIMLTINFTFIIFMGSSFVLLSHSLVSIVQLFAGSDFSVLSLSQNVPLNQNGLRSWLENEKASVNTPVKEYTFVSFSLEQYRFINNVRFTNLAQTPVINVSFRALERSFLDATDEQFYSVSELSNQFSYQKNQAGKPDVVKSLFDDRGKQMLGFETQGIPVAKDIVPVIENETEYVFEEESSETLVPSTQIKYIDILAPAGLKTTLSLSCDTPLIINVATYSQQRNASRYRVTYLAKLRALVDLMPGFVSSPYDTAALVTSTVFTDTETFRSLRNELYNYSTNSTYPTDEIEMYRLMIKLKDGHSEEDRDYVFNSLNNYVTSNLIQIIDTHSYTQQIDSAVQMLNLFFIIFSFVALFLCFFVLSITFAQNSIENKWELAVLRAIGLQSFHASMVFICESFCIVVSSIILGSLMGIIVSVMLILQITMFLNIPFQFSFPYSMFFINLGVSIAVSFLASYLPTKWIGRNEISTIIKG